MCHLSPVIIKQSQERSAGLVQDKSSSMVQGPVAITPGTVPVNVSVRLPVAQVAGQPQTPTRPQPGKPPQPPSGAPQRLLGPPMRLPGALQIPLSQPVRPPGAPPCGVPSLKSSVPANISKPTESLPVAVRSSNRQVKLPAKFQDYVMKKI